MKRGYFATLLLAAATLVGCQAESNVSPSVDGNATDKITLYAAASPRSTRVNFDEKSGEIVATWQRMGAKADAFSVYDAEGNYCGDFVYTGEHGATSGTFAQDGTFKLPAGDYTAVIPASTCATLSERQASLDISEQSAYNNGGLEHMTNYMQMSAKFTFTPAEDVSLLFEHELSLIKLNLKMPAGVTPASVTVTDGADGDSYKMIFPTNVGNVVSTYIAINANTAAQARDLSFHVENSDPESTDVFNDYVVSGTTQLFEVGKFYTYDVSYKADIPVVDYWTTGYTAPNGVTYDSTTADAQLLTTSGEISHNGVYFLDPASSSEKFTIKTNSYADLVIIGRYSDTQIDVESKGVMSFAGGNGVIFKNIHFIGNSANYTFNFSGLSGTINYWVFDSCFISTNTATSKKHLSYFNNASSAFENIIWRDNIIEVGLSANGQATRIFNIDKFNAAVMGKMEFTNNLMYSESGFYTNGAMIYLGGTADVPNLDIEFNRNTFVNYNCTSQAFLTVPNTNVLKMTDNIFWGDPARAAMTYMFRYTGSGANEATSQIVGNVFYGFIDAGAYAKYHSSSTFTFGGEDAKLKFTKESSNPFVSYSYALGSFVNDAAYADKGAAILWN